MSESRRASTTAVVRKRDGRCEPFDRAKITACLKAAVLASGEAGAETARELAEAVTSFVLTARREKSLRAAQILSLVRRVLIETGHPEAAGVIDRHASQRDHQRRQIQVLAWKASVSRIVPRRWNKSVLVGRLEREYGLSHGTARMIAARVENVVLSLGLRQVTGGLVRELSYNEMMAWGVADDAFAVRVQA